MTDVRTAGLLRPITDDERATWQRDGVVLLKAIYPPQWVAQLAQHLDDVFAGPSDHVRADGVRSGSSERGSRSDMRLVTQAVLAANPNANLAIERGAVRNVAARSIIETDSAHWHTGLRAHHLHGPLPELVHQLTGSAEINFYSDQLFLKEPGSLFKTPFHQDKPYFLVDGGDVAVVWVPVDTVTRESGAMAYLRGSHRSGRTYIPSDFATENGTFPEVEGIDHTGLERLSPIAADDPALVYFDVEPGDVIVHHWGTVHGSAGNTSSDRIRRAASIRYACAGCRFYRRPSSPEPFRKTVTLVDGDRLERADRFPIVWPR